MEEVFDKKKHWETIYETKALVDTSWYQKKPVTSLQFIEDLKISKTAKIIDVGGGDSFLIDHLLELGYTDITVLDISEKAIKRAKERLGDKADLIKWIVSDVTAFVPKAAYDVWHDRAAFHFLTAMDDIDKYIRAAKNGIKKEGHLIIGTFAETGPQKCSGIPIKQYSEIDLEKCFNSFFIKKNSAKIAHKTPFDTIQNFTFCVFQKK